MLDSLYVLESAMRHFYIRTEMGENAGRKQSEVDADYEKAARLASLAAPYRPCIRSRSCFPFAKVVFFVRQDMTDVTPLAVEMDNYDEAVLISCDVEHDELTNLICTAEDLPHVREILPASCFDGLDPMP